MSLMSHEKMIKSENAVYVSGLPSTAGDLQVADIFKRWKIRKIRLYRDASGIPKGDATIVFMKAVAEEIVDELDGFEVDQGGLGSYYIRVQQAEFRQQEAPTKPQQHTQKVAPIERSSQEQEPPKKKKRFAPVEAPAVVLRNLIAPEVQLSQAEAVALEEEVGRECLKYGRALDAEVLSPGNVVLVSFTSVDAARKCATLMHGRIFDQRIIRTELHASGRPAIFDHAPSDTTIASDYLRAPLPRNVDEDKPYVEPKAEAPTARLRSAALNNSGLPVLLNQGGMTGFVKASSPKTDIGASSTRRLPSPAVLDAAPPVVQSVEMHTQPPQPGADRDSALGPTTIAPSLSDKGNTSLQTLPAPAAPVIGGGLTRKKKRTAAADFFDDVDG